MLNEGWTPTRIAQEAEIMHLKDPVSTVHHRIRSTYGKLIYRQPSTGSAELDKLRDEVAVLRKAVQDLYQDLGKELPTSFA